MSGGAPRTHDRSKVAQDLIEWAQRETSINLCAFCREYKVNASPVIRWAKEDPDEFGQAYEYAKLCLGERREKMLKDNLIHVKAYDLNATTYDLFMRDERRSQAEFENSIKQIVAEPVYKNDEVTALRHELMFEKAKTLRHEENDRKSQADSVNTKP